MTRAGIRLVVGTAAACVCGATLGGCAFSHALAHARQACRYVDKSLQTFAKAQSESGTVAADHEQQALVELRKALPVAAVAAGEDAQWQGLVTTISESSRVPEADLVHALQAQCGQAQSNGLIPPTSATTVPATTLLTRPEPIGR